MRKALALLPLVALSSCAIDKTRETTLVPLNTSTTTEVPAFDTLPAEEISYSSAEFAFFDDVVYFYGSHPDIEDSALLEFGYVWCDLMTGGMTDADVMGRINEGAIDEDDRKAHISIVLAGIKNLCPSESDKAEYIALNSPLP